MIRTAMLGTPLPAARREKWRDRELTLDGGFSFVQVASRFSALGLHLHTRTWRIYPRYPRRLWFQSFKFARCGRSTRWILLGCKSWLAATDEDV